MAEERGTRAGRLLQAVLVFDGACELDGCGLVVTDENLMAKTLAEKYDVRPKEIYPEYAPEG